MAEYTIDKFTYGGNTYKLQDNESGYLTAADVPEGSSASTKTPTYVAATPSKGTDTGFARGDHVHGITSATITNALGYTPYSSANPNGYTSNTGTVTAVKINNTTKAASNGVVDIGTVLTTYTYTLPTASTTTLGGIKIGNGLNIGTTGVVSANVQSVNTKTGAVTLTAADVGALPSSTVVPTQTSQLQNNSGFLTSAVTSLNNKTGAVTITAGNNVTVSATSNTITISATDTDTKNTAGATTTSSTIYLIGATATTTNPQTYATNDLLYDDGLYSYAHYFDDNNYYAYRTALDQSGRVISLYNNDVQNNTYNTVSVSPTSINITANNPSSSVVIESPNNGTYIHNVVTPTADADVVNKEYIDRRINFSDADDQVWVNWYGEEAVIYGQQAQSVTYSFAIHMDDNKTKLTSATLARSYNGTDWNILGTLHPTSSFSNSFVPIGTILDFAGSTAPSGYLICDGRAVSRTTYANLFAVIGDTWGAGDGSTTFNVPNLCGRTTIGEGTGTASDATAHTLGNTGGTEGVTLTANESGVHSHGHSDDFAFKIPNHAHGLANSMIVYNNASSNTQRMATSGSGTKISVNTNVGLNTENPTSLGNCTKSGGVTDHAGQNATDAHNNMQPYATVNKIIKAV